MDAFLAKFMSVFDALSPIRKMTLAAVVVAVALSIGVFFWVTNHED